MSGTAFGEASRQRRLPVGLAAAVLLYLALRGLILHTAFDSVALWMFELYPMGTMAELSLRGVDFPVRYIYDNAAGQILFGWLTIPGFWLFGSTYLALKLVPLALGLATLLLVWVFLEANFGRRAANLGALLFALSPPTLVKYSLICSGNHFENLFFTMLALVCAYGLHRRPESRSRLFASGFSAGFALFVFLGALIPVGILAGMHVGVRGVRRTLRDLAWVLPGFGLGILPLVAINAATGARGLGFLGAKFGDEGGRGSGRVLARIGEYLGVHLPRAGVFEPIGGLSRAALGWIFLAVFAAAYGACLPAAARGVAALVRGAIRPVQDVFERAKIVPLVLYLPLAALAFGLSNLKIAGYAPPLEVAAYRYFLPTLLFGILAIAIVSARLWEKGGLARAGATALLAPVLFTGLSSFAIVDWTFSQPDLGRCYDGYDLSKMARALLSARNAVPPKEVETFVESLPPIVREDVIRAIGFNVVAVGMIQAGRRKSSEPDPELNLDAILADRPVAWRNDLTRGAGIGMRFHHGTTGRPPSEVVDSLARTRGFGSERERAWFFLGVGVCTPNPALPLESVSQAWLDADRALSARAAALSDPTQAGFLSSSLAAGRGCLCGRLFCRGIPSDRERVLKELGSISNDLESSFCLGLGLSVSEQPEPVSIPPGLLPALSERGRSAFWRGFGCGLRQVRGRDVARIAAPIRSELAGAELEALDRALESGALDLQLR